MSSIDTRTFRHYLRHFERELNIQNTSSCCCGVTLTQCHTLMELHNEDNIQLNELSQKLFLDKSTVSRTVESLVNQELVKREIPKQNRRTTNIKLSEKGLDVCETIHNGNDAYFEEALGAIPKNILPKFIEGFNTLVNKMIELNETGENK
tara:strand:+ start:471 stop:920 length:450 start_codon:yes stop_codon:yes gene_type:complete